MDLPRDRIAAACPKSKYKDDRHEWQLLMFEDSGLLLNCMAEKRKFTLRRCAECGLHVLGRESNRTMGGYNDAPRREDGVIYAFFLNPDLMADHA